MAVPVLAVTRVWSRAVVRPGDCVRLRRCAWRVDGVGVSGGEVEFAPTRGHKQPRRHASPPPTPAPPTPPAAAAIPHAEGGLIECEVSAVVMPEGGQAVQVAEAAQHEIVGLLLSVGSRNDAEMLRDGGSFVVLPSDAI